MDRYTIIGNAWRYSANEATSGPDHQIHLHLATRFFHAEHTRSCDSHFIHGFVPVVRMNHYFAQFVYASCKSISDKLP